ncbi:MAG TPA: type II secretion system F family protein [Isosphaeraceae bacterium]|nr:type II secretion system F family protein [Isosphaeraceae bacterium]
MNPTLMPMIVGAVVLGLVGLMGFVFLKPSTSEAAEQRLDEMSGRKKKKEASEPGGSALLKPPPLDISKSQPWMEQLFSTEWLNQLYEQADVGLAFSHFLAISGLLAVLGAVMPLVFRLPWPLSIPAAGTLGMMPLLWLLKRRKDRIKKFTEQMPDALELVARALRAGHGLASGLRVVAEEMPPPISHEFGRIFEEQNLGIPLDEAMRGLSERVPSMDVRFFVTAVIIQRATGGDLGEVLDKIGRLIRERFQILGQVQALTGEGRMSGAVLLAMPPSLLAFCYMMNPSYVSLLWTTSIGKKMLIVTAILQLVGAAAIKKIVTIKV